MGTRSRVAPGGDHLSLNTHATIHRVWGRGSEYVLCARLQAQWCSGPPLWLHSVEVEFPCSSMAHQSCSFATAFYLGLDHACPRGGPSMRSDSFTSAGS